jgi:hypothetical protein
MAFRAVFGMVKICFFTLAVKRCALAKYHCPAKEQRNGKLSLPRKGR